MPLQLKVKGGIIQEALYLLKDDTFYRCEVQQDVKQSIPRPEASVFEGERPDVTDFLMTSPQPIFGIEKMDYTDDGIFIYLIGRNGERLKYPTKGFPFPEAIQANNIFKRLLIGQIRYLATNPLGLIPFLFRRGRDSWLNEISSVAEITLGPYYLKDQYYMKTVKEIRNFAEVFMKELKIRNTIAEGFAKTIATMFEYDNAYLFRIQDLLNETTKELILKNPKKELKKLFEILKQRDTRSSMRTRFNSVLFLFSVALWIPRARKAFYKALSAVNFKNMQMDDNDRYQVLRWYSYDFFGKTYEERFKEFKDIHNGNVPMASILQS